MKEIQISNIMQKIIQLIFIFSLPFVTLIFSKNCSFEILIASLILSFIIGIFIAVKFIPKINKINLFLVLMCFIFSDYLVKNIYEFHFSNVMKGEYYSLPSFLLAFSSFMAIISLTIILVILYKKIKHPLKKFFSSFTKGEKTFLIVFSIITFFLTLTLYNITNVFYSPESANYDVVYTSDSPYLYKTNAFLNPNSEENSPAKQPLFGIFAIPFALIASLLSKIFFFFPNAYPVFLTFVQIVLIGIMSIMLARMFKIKEGNKIYFHLFYICTFSSFIFMFTLEQYIISTFYLILLMYIYKNLKQGPNYSFIASAGTLTTSAIMLPFLSKSKTIKEWLLNAFKCFLAFMAVVIMFGQFYFIFDFIQGIFSNLNDFGGKDVTITDRLKQYFSFVKGIFISIEGQVVSPDNNDYWYYQYLLKPINHFSKIGILILIACLVSLILNRKNKMAQVSFGWIIFSFILIVFVGYGTAENGVNLYSLYFSWAFIGLIYLLIDKIIKNDMLKKIIIACLCLLMVIINIPEFINIINFGIQYYKI